MVNSENRLMYVFPGQGAQYRGMGEDLYQEFTSARRVYERASEALGWDVAELSFRDPKDQLDLTAYTQPALLTHSVACLEAFHELTDGVIQPVIAAGHSLGEYTALVAGGALDFGEALRLVHRRGKLMSEFGAGQMLAVPLANEEIRPYAERHYCGVGGCNLPNQTVVGGAEDDLGALADELREAFPKARTTWLKTEGAFHTYLMVEAARRFRADLEEANLKAPRCEVLSNFTGDFHECDAAGIRYRLFFQLFNPVRWVWGVQRALEYGVTSILEFGGGLGGDSPATKRPNLASVIKRIVRAKEGRFGKRQTDVRTLTSEALYAPAINTDTVRSSAALALGLDRLLSADQEPPESSAGEWQEYNLYIPMRARVPLSAGADAVRAVEQHDLGDTVRLIPQGEPENRAFLAELGQEKTAPAPYLETVVAGESAALIYSTGQDLNDELEALAAQAKASQREL